MAKTTISTISRKELYVPPELLDNVFKFLEREVGSYDYKAQWHLLPLLFVCKEWHDIAQRRLYLSVGFEGAQSAGRKELENNVGFCESVKANPSITSLVREVRVGAFYRSAEESTQHAQLIRLCNNVQHVVLAGNDRRVLGPVKDALAQVDLIEFTLSHLGPRDVNGTQVDLCSPSEIIRYMLNWPHLRKFVAQTTRSYEEVSGDEDLPCPSTIKARCPDLRETSFTGCTFNAPHLLLLAALAPRIEKISISINGDALEAFQTCLQRWSQSLTHLSISVDDIDPDFIADAYPDLFALTSLTVPSKIMPPDTLASFTRLDTLSYTATTEHIEGLSDVLRQPTSLPSLKTLHLTPFTHLWCNEGEIPRARAAVLALREAAKWRGVTLSGFAYFFGY